MFKHRNSNGLQASSQKEFDTAKPAPKFKFFKSTSSILTHGSCGRNSPVSAMISTPSASFEDCLTNVLALTELSGLRWRRLTASENYVYGVDLDADPILSAYTQCVRENFLCTWRRQRQEAANGGGIENVALKLDTAKELWIFWYLNEYSDEPEIIKTLTSGNGLIAPDDTEFCDWSVRYETRTLFFKALHNVLERNMLKDGYIRFGKWFTRPLDEFAVSQDCALSAYSYGFRFEFAIQGENNVCATVKIQCQPPILRLNAKHLHSANRPLPVILAPWSIRAVLLPQQPLRELQNSPDLNSSLNSSGFSILNASINQQKDQNRLPEEVQAAIDEQWAQWSSMMCMASTPTNLNEDGGEQNENQNPSTSSGKSTQEKLPRFVAVEIDNVPMFYPSCFVGVVAQDLNEQWNKTDQHNLMSDDFDPNDSLVGFSQNSQIDMLEIRRQKVLAMKKKETFVPEILRHHRKSHVGARIARRSFEDAALAPPPIPLPNPSSLKSENSIQPPPPLQRTKTETGLHLNMPSTSVTVSTNSNASDDLRWNYFDYLRKAYCYCSMCSAGGGNSNDAQQPTNKTTSAPSTSSFVFHRSNFNDRLGTFGPDPNLFSPPQTQPKIPSPEQTQKDLEFLTQLDEKEKIEKESSEPRIPIFARTIGINQRTAIPSDRLNFAGVQECNFHILYKRHLSEIGFPIEPIDSGTSTTSDFDPFTPITCVTPDPETNQDFNNPENQWTDRIRTFNYPFHPQKNDFLTEQPYHVREQREKPIGPRPKISSNDSRQTPQQTPSQNSSILKSLLEAPDDDSDCQRPMRQARSPQSQKMEDQEWKRHVGEALRQRRKAHQRRYMSRRERELRQWYAERSNFPSTSAPPIPHQQSLNTLLPPSSNNPMTPSSAHPHHSLNQNEWQTSGMFHQGERSFSTSSLNDNSLFRDRLLSPQINQQDEEMEIDQQHHQRPVLRQQSQKSDVLWVRKMRRGKSLPSSCALMDPLRKGEEKGFVEFGPIESVFYGPKIKERYLRFEERKKGRIDGNEENLKPIKDSNDYNTLRRMIHDDLVEVEDPKTPIANLNSSLSSTQLISIAGTSTHTTQDLQQLFTSTQSNDVHSILSPPASNEQIDGNPLSSLQQHTPGDKSQNQQAQLMVPVGQGSLMLHSGGWNTTAVTATNSIHDSLNIIYPTPPTPLQQFSPLNVNPVHSVEDSQSKKRRLVEDPDCSENEQMEEDQIESEGDYQGTTKLNGFLGIGNLAEEILKSNRPSSPVYSIKKLELPVYSDRFIGDLLDVDIDSKKKLKWLKHLKREPARRQRLKDDLRKRGMRSEIPLPPEYVCQSKARRLLGPTCALAVLNQHDLQKLAIDAVELAGARRKPISGYGCGDLFRLNQMYIHEKRQWESRQFKSDENRTQSGNMMRQFSTNSGNGIFPPQMNSQMMMGQQGPRPFNPYAAQNQQQFGGGPMTPQQQMMMQMGRGSQGQFNPQMHPNGPSPAYSNPNGMIMSSQNSNFPQNRIPPGFNPQSQQRLGGHGSPMSSTRYPTPNQQQQQPMPNYFNNPSPASSFGSSNPPSQLDQQIQQPQRPGSVAIGPPSNSQSNQIHPPSLPFGSPGIPNSVGFQQQRTPSMPPSNTAANQQGVFSVEDPESSLVQRSQVDQAKIDDVLSLFQSCRSRIIAVLMKDTISDLYYDSVFDACPICSCNANIRSAELGLYVQAPAILAEVLRIQQRQQQDSTFKLDYWSGLMTGGVAGPCFCGFSAVRHRILCGDGRGLFTDDVQEAGAAANQFKPALARGNDRSWSKKRNLTELMDCLRFLSLNRNLATCFNQAYYLGEFPSEDIFTKPSPFALSSSNANYIVSRVEVDEFDIALKSAIQVARGQSWAQPVENRLKKTPLHPWGFQVASQIREPKDQECLAVIREIQCVLDKSIKEMRKMDPTNPQQVVEGPLTWRFFHRKAVKTTQEDDSYRPEQIPQILVSADRDPISTNPQLVHMWEKLTMGPYDQAKDVLYLAVVPDSNVIVEKCKVFLEELSTIYEKCRFGRHAKLATKDAPRDGIIRVNMKANSVANAAAQGLGANNKFNEEDRKLHLRISTFCDQVLAELKAAVTTNDSIFERRAYYETLYRDSLQPNYTSLATSTDSNYMPPPAVPMIQSPPSILSTASGPASQPLNPMSNPTPPANSSLFSAPNTNQLPSPALSTSENLMEPLRTPEVSIGTPGDPQQSQIQQQQIPPSQHLSPEAVEKAIDERMLDDHPLSLPHLIVIYLVNPFTFGSETCTSKVAKSTGAILMKTFNSLLSTISPRYRPQLQIELINLQTLYDYSSFVADPLREERQLFDDMSRNDKPTAYDCLRRVAFSVYSQTRLLIPEHARGAVPSSMTRFGPASSISDILDDLNKRDPLLYFKVPTMPFVLAPMEVLGVESPANNKIRLLNPAERVLCVSYCLPSDDFLCAAVTDQYGHLADNVVINLHVDQPTNQLRYKNKSQIFDAIHRLWLYIQSVLAMETRNWRLVISRVGKIGHGEFKVWSQILSKNNLRAFNSTFKGRDRGDGVMSAGLGSASGASNCRACQQTAGTQEIPIILSACLLSMEAEPNLRIFASSNSSVDLGSVQAKTKGSTRNNNTGQQQILDDSAITHIVTFPISPDIFETQHGGNQQADQEEDMMFEDLDLGGEDLGVEGIDQIMGDTGLDGGTGGDTTIDHQPMAIGYIVSTAPANDLPDWFWNICPSMKRQLPVHLKNALHINSSNIHDELSIGQKTGNETFHPLDDTATDSLLRHVMKVHNALSWLNVDVANGTRHSCLPVHMQALFRLYRTVETIYS